MRKSLLVIVIFVIALSVPRGTAFAQMTIEACITTAKTAKDVAEDRDAGVSMDEEVREVKKTR